MVSDDLRPRNRAYARNLSRGRGRSQPAPTARLIPEERPFGDDGATRAPVLIETLEELAARRVVSITAAATALRREGAQKRCCVSGWFFSVVQSFLSSFAIFSAREV